MSELNALIDEINALGGRLKSFFNHKTVCDSHQKLERWRKECHQKIYYFFESKQQELYQLIAGRVVAKHNKRPFVKSSPIWLNSFAEKKQLDMILIHAF